MTICALETSGMVASASVYVDGQICAEETLDGQLTHSQIALPMLERVVKGCGLTIDAIDAFAVNVGPGSFTGLRIGICGVNAMAAALDKPIAAIDSLTALAGNVPFFSGTVCALIDARHDQVYAGAFDVSSGFPVSLDERFAGSIDAYIGQLPGEGAIAFVGDGVRAHCDWLAERVGERARFMPPHVSAHRAATLAWIASRRVAEGDVCAEAMPLYLRAPQAVRQREQRGDAR